MFESFENQPKEKKEKIITAALEEFADKGYKRGSTNAIIKKADISKGILFHYFGNKANLFLYLVDYAIEQYYSDFDREKDLNISSDIFERMADWSILGVKIALRKPILYEFLSKAFINIPDDLEEEMLQRYEKLYIQGFKDIFEGIDKTKFKKNINPDKAIEILIYVLEGLDKKYIKIFSKTEEHVLDYADKLVEEINEYLHMLKIGLYDEA